MGEEQFTYKYFTNGVWPIRAILSDDTIIGTETPNKQTGEMQRDSHWFIKVFEDRSGDIKEISKEEFDQMVVDFLSQKKTKAQPPEISGMG